jgi:hypothetical protein
MSDDEDDVFHDTAEEHAGDAEPDAGAAGGSDVANEPWRADGVAAADEAFEMLLACESAQHAFWEHAGYEQGIEARARAPPLGCPNPLS